MIPLYLMSEMKTELRDVASSLNCPTPPTSPATPAASRIALSIDENLQRVPPILDEMSNRDFSATG